MERETQAVRAPGGALGGAKVCNGYTGTLPKFGLPTRGPEEGWSLPSPTAQLPRMGRALRKENNEGVF